MANTLAVDQIYSLVNTIVSQATGGTALTVTNTKDLVTVGQTALLTGYDPIMSSISQVLSKTIFSIRPYSRKFKGMEYTEQEWGNHVRKLNVLDSEFQTNDSYNLSDGYSIDQYVVKKPEIVQTNFYGQQTYEYQDTIFEDQLKVSFTDIGEMNSFLSGIMMRAANQLEQAREELARATIVNMIGAKCLHKSNTGDTNICVIKLITDYNAAYHDGETGPADFEAIMTAGELYQFAAFVIAKVKEVMRLMEHRNTLYHYNLKYQDASLMRNTPRKDQRVYLLARVMEQLETAVYSQAFHDDYLKIADFEAVSYWQQPNAPDSIEIKPVDFDTAQATYGAIKEASSKLEQSGIFGVICDRQAMGYTVYANKVRTSPYNAKGEYYNIFYKDQYSFFNDFSENCVVLLLE